MGFYNCPSFVFPAIGPSPYSDKGAWLDCNKGMVDDGAYSPYRPPALGVV